MTKSLRSLSQTFQFGVTTFLMFSMVMVYGQCPLPTPVSNPVTVSCGNTATLTASGSSGTYVWFSDAAATQQVPKFQPINF